MRFRVRQYLVLFSALFLIALAIMPQAHAALTVNNVAGSASVIGFRAQNDTVGINVTSTSNASFNGKLCTKQSGNSYICIAGPDAALTGSSSYLITNTEGNVATAAIRVDNNIGSVSYTVKITSSGATLEYIIRDLGFNNNNGCSGIKTIEVYDGSTLVNTQELAGNVGKCDVNGSIVLSLSGSGTKSIYLKVKDNVGNMRTTPVQNISLDLDAPQIINGLVIKQTGTKEELNLISNSALFLVDIYFSIREDNIASIKLDLSDININPAVKVAYKNFNLPLSSCSVNASLSQDGIKVYDCIVRSVPMKISDIAVDAVITVIDTYGVNDTKTLSKTFTVDNEIPRVSIKTNRCDENDKCYVKNGQNEIIVSVNKQLFEKKLIFFNIPGSTFGINRVQNCSSSECMAAISLTCGSGSRVDATITSSQGINSQDDAGNFVSAYTTYLYCDNNAPRIENITVTTQTSSVINDLVSGSNIKIEAIVREIESDELKASVWLDKIKNSTEDGDCSRIDEDNFRCIWNIAAINDGYYDATIVVNVSDIAGNIDSESKGLKVYGFKSDNETPNNLGLTFREVFPKNINRVVLDMATRNGIPYYVYATYDIDVVKGNDVTLLYQRLDISKCMYVNEEGSVPASVVFAEIKISNPYADTDDISRLDLLFPENTDPNILSDEFEISCNISATVKEGNYIYKNPQELNIVMPFKLSNTKLCNDGEECTPGERLGKKIKDAEDNFLVRAEILGTVGSIIPKVQQICNLRGYITQGSAGAQILSMAANVVSVGTQNAEIGKVPIGVYLQLSNLDACFSGGSTSAYSATSNVQGTGQVTLQEGQSAAQVGGSLASSGILRKDPESRQRIAGKCSEIVGKACDFLSCSATQGAQKQVEEKIAADNAAAKDKLQSSTGLGGSAFLDRSAEALTHNINVPDYKNSAIMAAAEGCWPAVLYNVNKWRQSECNYVYCLKMAAYTGTDVSACDAAKKTQTCSLIVGEIFEMPGARQIKNLAENAADYTRNLFPLAAASAIHKSVCPEYTDSEQLLSGKKGEVPSDIATQTWKIYGCQLPLQLARFADSNMRSNMRGGGNFVYPEMPDMCQYASCVGEPNCKYEPDFWDTINKMRLVNPKDSKDQKKIDTDRAAQQAGMNQNVEDLATLSRLANQRQLTPEQATQYNTLLKKFQNGENGGLNDINQVLTPQEISNTMCTEAGDGACGPITIDPEERKKISNYYVKYSVCAGQYARRGTAVGYSSSSVDCYNILSGKNPSDDSLHRASLSFNGSNYDSNNDGTPDTLNIEQQLSVYQQKAKALNDITFMDNQLKGIGNPDDLDPVSKNVEINTPWGEKMTLGQMYEKRNQYFESAGRCGGSTGMTCNEYSKRLQEGDPAIVKEHNEKMREYNEATIADINKYSKEVRTYKNAQSFGNTLYVAMQYLNANRMLEWMYTDYWTEKWFGDKMSNYVDPNKWKESLCNPINPINTGGTSNNEVVLSCTGGVCQPALTYTTERTMLQYPNGTRYYVYTSVYYISSGDLRGRATSYNVYFNGEGDTIKGFRDPVNLRAFDIISNKTAFVSPVKYTQMCVEFSKPFPEDNSLTNALKYCRPIVENGFDTGSPWSPEEEDAGAAGYTNQYDSNGDRVKESGTNTNSDNRPPGVFE